MPSAYTYNADGIRTQKTVNGVTTEYYLDGTSILRQVSGEDVLEFFYDTGSVVGFYYNGTPYYYLKNMQGDVVGILDGTGTQVAAYSYDAWGNLLSVTGPAAETLGRLNPFRYRSYYYDTETGLYYLNSRYYDAETGRYLSADAVTDGEAGILGNNLFIYAANNPVNNSDPTGQWIIKDAIKWVAKNVVKPAVKAVKNTLSKIGITYSRGISISGTPSIFNFSMQAGISLDTKGNVSFQGSFSSGVTGGSPGASITLYKTITNAPNVKKLEGSGYQIGGSAGIPVYGVPIAAGGDFNLIPDTQLNKAYYGITTSAGFGTPGGEFHIEWGETVAWKQMQFNIFDVAKGIYIKIMEW